jgi:hypothetical protein
MSVGDVVQSIAQEEPKQHPMKHGSRKQKPPPLHQCAERHGKGQFVHGYYAPVPHGGSTGTGIGYWHADKQKWLLWEPDPLDQPEDKEPVGTIVSSEIKDGKLETSVLLDPIVTKTE